MDTSNRDYVERFIEKDMLSWKADNNSALIITGGRQVGKTTTVRHFAFNNYEHVVYVNVGVDSIANKLANTSEHNIAHAVREWCSELGITYTDDKDTVLIFDEIEENEQVYEKICLFNRKLGCDVIITGVYLGKTEGSLQPAEDLTTLQMFPLSYAEYLNYYGAYDYFHSNSIDTMSEEGRAWLKKVYDVYLIVGGYPEIFCAYKQGEDLNTAFEKLLEILKVDFQRNTDALSDSDEIDYMFGIICRMMSSEKQEDYGETERFSEKQEDYGETEGISEPPLTLVDRILQYANSEELTEKTCRKLLDWMLATHVISYVDTRDLADKSITSRGRICFEDVGLANYLCDTYCIENSAKVEILTETFAHRQLLEE